MAKKTYLVASEEGATYAKAEVGETVELDVNHSDERALLCAGWLEAPTTKAKGGKS